MDILGIKIEKRNKYLAVTEWRLEKSMHSGETGREPGRRAGASSPQGRREGTAVVAEVVAAPMAGTGGSLSPPATSSVLPCSSSTPPPALWWNFCLLQWLPGSSFFSKLPCLLWGICCMWEKCCTQWRNWYAIYGQLYAAGQMGCFGFVCPCDWACLILFCFQFQYKDCTDWLRDPGPFLSGTSRNPLVRWGCGGRSGESEMGDRALCLPAADGFAKPAIVWPANSNLFSPSGSPLTVEVIVILLYDALVLSWVCWVKPVHENQFSFLLTDLQNQR